MNVTIVFYYRLKALCGSPAAVCISHNGPVDSLYGVAGAWLAAYSAEEVLPLYVGRLTVDQQKPCPPCPPQFVKAIWECKTAVPSDRLVALIEEMVRNLYPILSIIILRWNTADLLLATCTQHSDPYLPSYEVIVVDNNSSDNSAAQVRVQFPQVPAAAASANLGTAGVTTWSLAAASAPYMLLLSGHGRCVSGAGKHW
ncbi:MAG: hypothetical protein H6662_02830 [Ardenticatenaceae bacterium]|nr:hypothetical protein [Ardenticatenaceae bacterium]